jgi:hypothetical protein
MARVSIYVQDELKSRMDRIGESVNWSEVVRPAILSEIASHEHRKGANMTTVIDRLRASKEKYVQEVAGAGKGAGRAWAADKADYRDLKRIAAIEEPQYDSDDWALTALWHALDPEHQLDGEEMANHLRVENEDDLTEEFARGFIEGAREIFEEVEDQI